MTSDLNGLTLNFAAAGEVFGLECSAVSWDEIAATDAGGEKARSFSMVAYTGGPMRLPVAPYPVVVDLAGMQEPGKSRPILRDHDSSRIVGHTTAISVAASSIDVAGVISAKNAHASEVVDSSLNGFPWQASIGCRVDRVEFVKAGAKVTVNGKTFNGPLYVARQSQLKEVSFVALGADDNTSAKIAAAFAGHDDGGSNMGFEAWVKALGFNPDDLTAAQRTSLEAAYKQVQAAEGGAGDGGEGNENPTGADVNAAEPVTADQVVAAIRAENARTANIRRICAGNSDLEARAISENWNAERAELEVLRASRAAPSFGIHVGGGADQVTDRTIEAAACLSVGLDGNSLLKARQFTEQDLDRGSRFGHMGVRDLIAACCRLEGKPVHGHFGDGDSLYASAFSTMSLPNILSSVMNKSMLAAYESVPGLAMKLCRSGSVKDFKQVSRYRLLGTGAWERVAADGELKGARFDEQAYTNQADTYGQIMYLTRKDVINDDLGAFMDLPRQMGQGAASLLESTFWTLVLANTGNFFHADNSNLLTTGSSALSYDALTAAKTQFRKKKAGPGGRNKDKQPIDIRPAMMVVPVELEIDAQQLLGSANFVGGDGQLSRNPHANTLELHSTPHLSDTFYTGSSTTAWYLWAAPAAVAAYEVVFLNGKKTPTIQRVEGPANQLVGMGFRGFFDFGFNSQDPRGALKNAGA